MIERLAGSVEEVHATDPFTLAAGLAGIGLDELAAAPADEAEVVIAAAQRVINAASARLAVATAAYSAEVIEAIDTKATDRATAHAAACAAARESGRARPPAPHPLPPPLSVAAAATAPLLRVSPRAMATRVRRALDLTDLYPHTLTRAWAGDLEPARVDAVLSAAETLDPTHATEFEARLYATHPDTHPDSDGTEAGTEPGTEAGTGTGTPDPTRELSTSRLGQRATRAAARVDPASLTRRAEQARARRGVRVHPGTGIGMARWLADLPTDASTRMYAAVDALGREYHAADPTRTLTAARADALTDLVLANATITTTIELLLLPVTAHPNQPDHPNQPAHPNQPDHDTHTRTSHTRGHNTDPTDHTDRADHTVHTCGPPPTTPPRAADASRTACPSPPGASPPHGAPRGDPDDPLDLSGPTGGLGAATPARSACDAADPIGILEVSDPPDPSSHSDTSGPGDPPRAATPDRVVTDRDRVVTDRDRVVTDRDLAVTDRDLVIEDERVRVVEHHTPGGATITWVLPWPRRTTPSPHPDQPDCPTYPTHPTHPWDPATGATRRSLLDRLGLGDGHPTAPDTTHTTHTTTATTDTDTTATTATTATDGDPDGTGDPTANDADDPDDPDDADDADDADDLNDEWSPLESDLDTTTSDLAAIDANPHLARDPIPPPPGHPVQPTARYGRVWYITAPAHDTLHGVLLPQDLQHLLTDADLRVRAHPVGPATTGLDDGPPTARTTYRPRAALAHRVRTRDHTCRFPGCGVPADRCDLDHLTPYPTGTTCETNLATLCRTHHGFKHHAGWTVTMTPDATLTWTTPTGRTHTTRPPNHHDPAA